MLTIKFNETIYSSKSLRAAVRKFQDFGSFRISQRAGYYHVSLQKRGPDTQAGLVEEFKNYVLYLTIAYAKK